MKSLNKHIKENLTIPQNKDDKIEVELYKKLEKNYDHSDRIVRWYRNSKKSGVKENELKKTFVDNIVNIKDLFKTYDSYIDSLKKMKMLNKKVEIENNGKKLYFDPVKDIDRIRRLEGFQIFVKAIGDMVHSGTSIETSSQKYAITDKDRKNIKLVGFSEHVMCWSTRGYETTNKFVFQLWQNEKTLGRGDVYGDPTKQTPYCTHSKEHWNDYSDGNPNYEQYWFLKKPDDDLTYVEGDLSNENVVHIFKSLKGQGKDLLIAMNDSNEDFLNKYDEEFDDFRALDFGNEVKKINNKILDIIYKKYNNDVNEILSNVDIIKYKTIPNRLLRKITSIIIPNNVKSIDDDAFADCVSLKEIHIPDSIISIGERAFEKCISLREITIPNSVTNIGDGAFYDCKDLKEVNIHNNVKSIGDWAFAYCSSLTSVTIPESVTIIGEFTFAKCESLKEISIHDNVTSIGKGAFSHCNSLTSIIIPDSVTNIDNGAFYKCSSLEEITIPDSVTNIGNGAFYECSSLEKITIPDSVTNIGPEAFSDCSSLKSIYVKGNMEKIKEVFEKTDNKDKIHILKPLTINESINNLILYWAELIKGNQY